jgi:hypothetical protein
MAYSKISGLGSSFSSLPEIFQGVIAIVVLRIVTSSLGRRKPFLGDLAARIAERFFGPVDARRVPVAGSDK